MNTGGITAAQPPTVAYPEVGSRLAVPEMTYDDERLTDRYKERRARFCGSTENAKAIAECTKVRQEAARAKQIEKERSEMEKCRKRYLDAAVKQYVDQQAKNREISMGQAGDNSRVPYPAGIPMQQPYYPDYMNEQCAGTQTMQNTLFGTGSAAEVNVRKRPYSGETWPQYGGGMICAPSSTDTAANKVMRYGNDMLGMPTVSSSGVGTILKQPLTYTESESASALANMERCAEKYAGKALSTENDRTQQYDINRIGTPAVPSVSKAVGAELVTTTAVTTASSSKVTDNKSCDLSTTTSNSSSTPAGLMSQATSSADTLADLSKLPPLAELVDSQMEKLIDQLGQPKSLNDLGDNCLDEVLETVTSDDDARQNVQPQTTAYDLQQQASISSMEMTPAQNPCSNCGSVSCCQVISPMSMDPATPHSNMSHISASVCRSVGPVYESNGAVMPQQMLPQQPIPQQQMPQKMPPQMSRQEMHPQKGQSAIMHSSVMGNRLNGCVPSTSMNGHYQFSPSPLASAASSSGQCVPQDYSPCHLPLHSVHPNGYPVMNGRIQYPGTGYGGELTQHCYSYPNQMPVRYTLQPQTIYPYPVPYEISNPHVRYSYPNRTPYPTQSDMFVHQHLQYQQQYQQYGATYGYMDGQAANRAAVQSCVQFQRGFPPEAWAGLHTPQFFPQPQVNR